MFFLLSHCRQRAAAGRPGADSVQGLLHHSEALQPHPSAPVCGRLSWLPGLRPRCGPVSEQRLGRSGCTGEEAGQRDEVYEVIDTLEYCGFAVPILQNTALMFI